MDEVELQFLKEVAKMNEPFINDFFPKPIKNHFINPKYSQSNIQKNKARYIDSDGFEHYYNNENWYKKRKPIVITYHVNKKKLEISSIDFDFLNFEFPRLTLFDWFNDHLSGMGFYGGEMKDSFVGDKIGKKGSFYGWESNPQTFGTSPNAGATISQIKKAVKVGKYLKNAASIKSSFENKNEIDMITVDTLGQVNYNCYIKLVEYKTGKMLIYGNKTEVKRKVDSINKITNYNKHFYKTFFDE